MISKIENNLLTSIPSLEEIEQALFDMHALKAPGPNGLPALFSVSFYTWQVNC